MLIAAVVAFAEAPALRDRLADAHITPSPALPALLADARAPGGADLADDAGYVAAWWDRPDYPFTALHLFAADRRSGRWRHAQFPAGDLEPIGATLEVAATPRYLTVAMHLNPSAVSTLVFTRNLARAGSFYGWAKARLPNELIVFEASQVHFAPTHPLEISVYDPAAASARRIYPPAPSQAVRREFIDRVKARWASVGERWFMDHNHHGDAARFDADSGALIVDWPDRSLAFEVTYRDELPDAPALAPISEQVIVACDGLGRASTVACRETRAADWKKRFPGDAGDALLRRAAAQPRLVPW